jgi:hypothetical protein
MCRVSATRLSIYNFVRGFLKLNSKFKKIQQIEKNKSKKRPFFVWEPQIDIKPKKAQKIQKILWLRIKGFNLITMQA